MLTLPEVGAGIEDITAFETQVDDPGIEPGQIAVMTAEDIDQNFMVESVDFTQIAPEIFRFTCKGSDANVQRRNSGPALFQKLLSQATQARDRVQTPVVIAIFVSDPPNANPGSYTGTILGAIRIQPTNGVCVKVTLDFQSVKTGPATTQDVIIDWLYNGVSIFPSGDPAKLIYPAGATTAQTFFIFLNDPQEVQAGGTHTLFCIQADPNAFDGVAELTVQG